MRHDEDQIGPNQPPRIAAGFSQQNLHNLVDKLEQLLYELRKSLILKDYEYVA